MPWKKLVFIPIAFLLITVVPAPAGAVPHSETMRAIHETSIEFGVSESMMIRVADCESGLNPLNNSNRRHKGLFQQKLKYWQGRVAAFNAWTVAVNRTRAHDQQIPPVLGNIFSPFDNARVSGRMMKDSGLQHWSCK